MPLVASQTNRAGRVELDVATPADDAEVRRLYRDNPMGGAVRLSLEREPDAAFAAGIEGDSHETIVARRPGAGLCAAGARSVRKAFANGESTQLGYLGGLRVDADFRNNPRLLLKGYAKLRELHESAGDAQLYLTSIVADNTAARRLLEAGLRGMPTYRFAGEFVTLVMRLKGRREMFYTPSVEARRKLHRLRLGLRHATSSMLEPIAATLNRSNQAMQFAPVWTAGDLASASACRGLAADEFRVAINSRDEVVGCAALWDQRPFKQAVVRGYSPSLSRWRPLINAASAVTGHPRLPDIGERVRAAYVSHVAGRPAVVVALIEAIHALAGTRSLDYLTVGFAAGDPRLAAVRRAFGGHELRTRLYVAHWPDGQAAADALDGRPLGPEVALL